MGGINIFLLVAAVLSGIAGQGPVQVLPEGIQSVNGSSTDMGCTSALVDSGGVMTCNSQSYLVDGCSPDIDTSSSDWASQLVTVRRVEGTAAVPFAHVLLTFGFDTAVSLTGIEIDLFLCPDWGIGAPRITVSLNEEYNLAFRFGLSFLRFVEPSQSSCDSLTTVHLSGDILLVSSYHTFHFLVTLSYDSSIQWVHIREVRFLSEGGGPAAGACLPSSSPALMSSTLSFPTSSFPVLSTRTPPVTSQQTSSHTSTHSPPSSSSLAAPPSPLSPASSPVPQPQTTSHHTLSSHPSSPTTTKTISETTATTTDSSTTTASYSTVVVNPLGPDNRTLSVRTSTTSPIATSYPTATASGTPPGQDNQPLFNRTTTILTGAVAAAMLVLVLVTLVFVIYCCASRKQRRPAKKREKLESSISTKDSSLKYDVGAGLAHHRNPATSPIRCGFPSPLHEQYNATAFSDGHYQGVVARRRQEDMGDSEYSYAYVSLSEAKTRVRYSSAKYDYVDRMNPSWSLRRPIQQEKLEPKKVEAPTAPLPIYSNIPNAASPSSVPKLEASDYETMPPSPDEVVVSEYIDPSDFMCGSELKQSAPPQVYGPVYPSLVPIPGMISALQISSDNVLELNEGTGQYGSAVLAVTKGLSLKDMRLSKDNNNRNLSILLAVKKLPPQPSESEREAFDREVEFMCRIKHPNIAQFIGVCYEKPTFLMMEYMEEGDLNQFLQRYSVIVPTNSSSETEIAASSLVYIASQIARGMKHLAHMKFIHRDIATRKCFVGSNFAVKLADFGTNTRYQSQYYRIRGNILLPIRWMAPECFYGKFSEKTDVWAFGVTMWELFTLAKQDPYSQLSDEQVVQNALKKEGRQILFKPSACPKPVYEVIERCWCLELKQRATFQELDETLQSLQ